MRNRLGDGFLDGACDRRAGELENEIVPRPRRAVERDAPLELLVHADRDPLVASRQWMLRRGPRRGYRRRDTVDERDRERSTERVAAIEVGEFRLGPQRSVDAPVDLAVDEHPRHDDKAMEVDSDARQLAREDKRAEMREILVQFTLRDERYRFRPPQKLLLSGTAQA